MASLRPLFRAFSRPTISTLITPKTLPILRRNLSDDTRRAIKQSIESHPVVLFMKGTPETPQCGFSRATVQILGLHGVDPEKFAAFNVLEDEELRQGIKEYSKWPTIPQLYVNVSWPSLVAQLASSRL